MIEFPMTTNYVYHWGHTEAAREIISNAYDSEIENGSKTEISYFKSAERMRVLSTGVSIDRRAFFLGESSKRGNDIGLIGKFGEGLTLASLVLARIGARPKIVSNGKEYIPSIGDDNIFRIHESSVNRNTNKEVSVSWKCTEEMYEEARSLFLGKQEPLYSCYQGDMIGGTRGLVYVRGVRVSTGNNMLYSYNLKTVELGRDRDAVDHWTLKFNIGEILSSAFVNGKVESEVVFNSETEDVRSALENMRYNGGQREVLERKWSELYGGAVPASSYEDVRVAESYAIKSVLVNKLVTDVLYTKSVKDAISLKALTPKRLVPLDELSEVESDHFLRVLNKVGSVYNRTMPNVVIVEFNDPNLNGTYCDGTVYISRHIVSDIKKLLITVVHEVCHDNSLDNTKSHSDDQIKMLASMVLV